MVLFVNTKISYFWSKSEKKIFLLVSIVKNLIYPHSQTKLVKLGKQTKYYWVTSSKSKTAVIRVHVLGEEAGAGHLSGSNNSQSGKKVKHFCHRVSEFSGKKGQKKKK